MIENKELLKLCMQRGFLLEKEVMNSFGFLEKENIEKFLSSLAVFGIKEKIITRQIIFGVAEKILKIFSSEDERKRIELFFENIGYKKSHISDDKQKKSDDSLVKVLSTHNIMPKKVEVKDFVSYFRSRYEQLKNILQTRNLENLKSIRRITNEREVQHIIVCVLEKRITKNKNIILDVEDLSGRTKVLINENKKELFEKAKNVLVDEVVALNVSGNNEILFANDIIFPDSFLAEKKKCEKDVAAAFCSDVHVGSKLFLEDNFLRFVKWLNGEEGSDEQKNLAKKVKYLFFVGDNIDGVGVYPDQEKLLKIPEVKEQYKKFAELLKLIRKDINIIISPGQHDAVWVGEPQPAIGEYWAEELYKMKNVILVTNPCLLEIEDMIKIIVYHGASFHSIVEEMPEIRLKYGYNFPTIITKELLKIRHLGPLHGSCDYVPIESRDPLVIEKVPDIVATGDLHKPEVSSYNNILLVAGSCWQSKTPFEEKVGNNPDPCKVPLVNLKTREIKILDFSDVENLNANIQGERIANEN